MQKTKHMESRMIAITNFYDATNNEHAFLTGIDKQSRTRRRLKRLHLAQRPVRINCNHSTTGEKRVVARRWDKVDNEQEQRL